MVTTCPTHGTDLDTAGQCARCRVAAAASQRHTEPGEIVIRVDHLHTVHVLAKRQPTAPDLATQIILIELQTRGVSVTWAQAEEIARTVIAAATYPPVP